MCLPPVVGPHSPGVDGILCSEWWRGPPSIYPVYSVLYTQVQARRCFTHQPDERLLALANQRPAATHFLYPQRFYWGAQVLVEAVNI